MVWVNSMRSRIPLSNLSFAPLELVSLLSSRIVWIFAWLTFKPHSKIFFRCATAASLKNYTHFGIQGYGECWSGPAAGKTYLLDGVENRFSQRPSPKPWLGCVGDGFERCRGGSDKCVGQENTNFVYAVVNRKLFWVQRRYVVTLK